MATRQTNIYETNADFALKLQPIAIEHYYKPQWADARLTELDQHADELSKVLDIGGADKLLTFPDGRVAFLGQRFRRWKSGKKYDDFTLRDTELAKVLKALDTGGFVASFYSYGLANEAETAFVKFRILHFRPIIEALAVGTLKSTPGQNKHKDDHPFIIIEFANIPASFFLFDSVGHQIAFL